MFNELVGLGNVIERKPCRNVKSRPPGLEGLVNRARSFHFRVNRYIVTPDEKESSVAEDEEPDRNAWRSIVCGVRGDRTSLRLNFNVALDVCIECHFNNVINAVGN